MERRSNGDEEVGPGGTVVISAQPDPAVQETNFAADVIAGSEQPERADPANSVDPARQDHGHNNNNIHHGNGSNGYGSIPTNGHHDDVLSPAGVRGGGKSPARAVAPDLLRGLLMVLMALDHNVMLLRSWDHGTGRDSEEDSHVVHRWNITIGYVIRTLTHLCAPGFTFLLGLGVVYFARSRALRGWSSGQMARHFAIRCVALIAVMLVQGLAIAPPHFWFMNVVLFALAIDYFLAGMLWLAVSKTERSLAFLLVKILPDRPGDDPTEPLLLPREGGEDSEDEEGVAPDRKIIRAANISWHLHNALLLALALVTIWWNIWLSPTHGRCEPETKTADLATSPAVQSSDAHGPLPDNDLIRIWFYTISNPSTGIFSGFPPLAWISFAILGLLYGRVILAASWRATVIAAVTAFSGLAFLLLFVLTRVFQFGNLSTGCLQTPEHAGARPDTNPYLVSLASFFYIVKYPPDVAFWAYTLGINLLLLALFAVVPARLAAGRAAKVLLVYGRSALFFYVLHIAVLAVFAQVLIAFLGHDMGYEDPWFGGPTRGVDQLWAFFGHYAVVMGIMYFLCKWYGAFKATKGPDSLWRFF